MIAGALVTGIKSDLPGDVIATVTEPVFDTATLKADLDRYAAMHAQTYGEKVDAEKLIPHMLEAFMAGDREFSSARRAK